ncbi:MAG: fumarylacetoacetate hydrolase family protein [Acidobacteria bacterium]|nr:fumarylacetoacetate hydrolase family protein [Acidobacteriota bacterium]MBV9482892.1 fumarylacetoacetate hydrolase family protein [Acidobacteriota bacterium]
MRYCRFYLDRDAHYGLVESFAGKEAITRVLLTAPEEGDGELEDLPSKRMDPTALETARLLAPVRPSKIVCVGRNYREHAAELGHELPAEPLLFLKPTSSLLGPGENIRRPKISQRTDYEGELGVVIGKTCYKLSPEDDVRAYILGYTCINDFTARDLQNKDGQWSRAKGFDTFCPAGPVVTDEIDPWAGVPVVTKVNGEVRQSGNTREFIFPLDVIIRHIAEVMTLHPGDLIATGTPQGVGPVVAGDVVEITVDGAGTLRNPIVDE